MKINEHCLKYRLCQVAVTLHTQTFDSQVNDIMVKVYCIWVSIAKNGYSC